MTLREVIDAAAAQYGLDPPHGDRPPTAPSRGRAAEQAFATLSADGTTASFLLDPLVAGRGRAGRPTCAPRRAVAAGSTCRPRVVDGHAADRAGAWFLSA